MAENRAKNNCMKLYNCAHNYIISATLTFDLVHHREEIERKKNILCVHQLCSSLRYKEKTADIILLCATFMVVILRVFFKCDNYICYDTKIMSQSSDTSISTAYIPEQYALIACCLHCWTGFKWHLVRVTCTARKIFKIQWVAKV